MVNSQEMEIKNNEKDEPEIWLPLNYEGLSKLSASEKKKHFETEDGFITDKFIEDFEKYLIWDQLSRYKLTEKQMNKHKEKIHWKTLSRSGRNIIPESLLVEFEEQIIWPVVFETQPVKDSIFFRNIKLYAKSHEKMFSEIRMTEKQIHYFLEREPKIKSIELALLNLYQPITVDLALKHTEKMRTNLLLMNTETSLNAKEIQKIKESNIARGVYQ